MGIPKDILDAIHEYGAEPLEMSDPLCFECQSSCWGTCCQKIDILMTPFDVYRMARSQNMTMYEFIRQYCELFPGSRSKWPIAALRSARTGRCDFLDEAGRCTIRDSRPSVCRSSPLGRISVIADKETNQKQEIMILKYPHPLCQQKNVFPLQSEQTVAEWMTANRVREWWNGTQPWMDLMAWALEEAGFFFWASDLTFRILLPYMFGMDELVPAGTSEEEMNRRAIAAVKALITGLAAGYGYGPMAENPPEHPAEIIAQAQAIMQTGTCDEAQAQTTIHREIFTGFTVVDLTETKTVFTIPSFDPQRFGEVLKFVATEASKGTDVSQYAVFLNAEGTMMVPGHVLIKESLKYLQGHYH